ncbi:MAG TPA: hypothetical protein VLJ39_02310 [Tepidisphaeraceae bacterium]|nr:hypothetical protein [Tepidisphaeraceae bacterium]
MTDPALENSDPSAEHVPWDSIGSSDGVFEEAGEDIPQEATDSDESHLPSELSVVAQAGISEHGDDSERREYALPAAREASDSSRTADIDPPSRGGGWTFPLLCAGIALIACCVLIPQADANRRLTYEREMLQRDLENMEKQIAVNREFLRKVADDPTLAQRLAERQMKVIPQGAHVLDLTHEPTGMSPFQLVHVAPPIPPPPYKPIGGTLSNLCYGAHSRLYLIGIALGMIATGLVMGAAPRVSQSRGR